MAGKCRGVGIAPLYTIVWELMGYGGVRKTDMTPNIFFDENADRYIFGFWATLLSDELISNPYQNHMIHDIYIHMIWIDMGSFDELRSPKWSSLKVLPRAEL